jgi:hypothetical protein
MARGRQPQLEPSWRLLEASDREPVEQFGVQRPVKQMQRHFGNRRPKMKIGRHDTDLENIREGHRGGGL